MTVVTIKIMCLFQISNSAIEGRQGWQVDRSTGIQGRQVDRVDRSTGRQGRQVDTQWPPGPVGIWNGGKGITESHFPRCRGEKQGCAATANYGISTWRKPNTLGLLESICNFTLRVLPSSHCESLSWVQGQWRSLHKWNRGNMGPC